MKVLGLDVSSSIIGATILSDDFTIDLMTHIDLTRLRGFWEKIDAAHMQLEQIVYGRRIDVVCVEEPAMMYSPGHSSAQTISLLTKFNALVSWKARELIGPPEYLTASSARKICGIKTQHVSKVQLSHKQQTFNQLTASGGLLENITISYTSSGKVQPFVYDEFDSYVIARAALIQAKQPTL